jgi:hypothetical protein
LLLWPAGSRAYRWAFAASFAWGAFVAASRVVMGAHYASDVLFSSALAFALMAFGPWEEAPGRGADAPPAQGGARAAQRAAVLETERPEDGK